MYEILGRLGFSEYKKRAYAELVRAHTAKAMDIAKRARIPSSKIYEVMQWLYDNGYVSIVNKSPITYKANDPKHVLKSGVHAKIEELKRLESDIESIKSDLDIAGRSDFQIIYGRDAFYAKVKEAVSKSDKSIIAIVKSFRLDYELGMLTKEFTQKGGKARFLGPSKGKDINVIREWKAIGVSIKDYTPDMTRFTVWDGHIIAIGLKDMDREYYSLWIDNQYLGRILTEYFEKLWK